MTDPDRDATRRYYNALSRFYDLLAGSSERELREYALALLAPKPGERMLEPGCGTGESLVALARAGARVTGVDLSPGMLAVARRRLERARLAERVELFEADTTALSFATGTFDAVFASFLLELFPADEFPAVLGEWRRVLAPGGRLVVLAMSDRRPGTPMARLYRFAHRRWPRRIDCRPIPVRDVIARAGFRVAAFAPLSTWGLAADAVLARPD